MLNVHLICICAHGVHAFCEGYCKFVYSWCTPCAQECYLKFCLHCIYASIIWPEVSLKICLNRLKRIRSVLILDKKSLKTGFGFTLAEMSMVGNIFYCSAKRQKRPLNKARQLGQ